MAEVTARKRSSGKWQYRFEVASINGKRKQCVKGGFNTKTEALKAGRKAMEEYENGEQLIVSHSDMSVSDLFDTWLNEVSKTMLKESTTSGYRKKIKNYIKPNIGHYKIKSITRQILQELLINLSNTGLSKNTLSSVRGLLTKCFDWAELNKLISQSPAYRLTIPPKTEIKPRTDPHVYIEPEKIKMIFDRFPEGTTSYIPMQIAYHCGLRLGEVYALTWDDIDFDNKALFVRRQVQWHQDMNRISSDKIKSNGSNAKGDGYWYFTSPKYKSFRRIDLDDILLAILAKEKAKQEKALNYYEELYTHYYSVYPLDEINIDNPEFTIKMMSDKTENEIMPVCRRENGEYITPRTMQHTSSVIHKQLNFPEFDFHSFRHTHATMLRDAGAPDIYTQRRLGHVKLETTKNIYQNHLTENVVIKGVNSLSNMF